MIDLISSAAHPRIGGRILRVMTLLILVGAAQAQDSRPADLDRVLDLMRQGRGPADPAQAADMRVLVDQGLTRRDSLASTWALLDLWLRAEWERGSDLPLAFARFHSAWPASRYRETAQWLEARWLARQGSLVQAAEVLLPLAAEARDQTVRRKADRLLDTLCGDLMSREQLAALEARAEPGGRAWFAGRRNSLVIHRRLGLVAPMKGPDAAIGTALRAGVEAALSQHEQTGSTPWELVVEDCQSDPLQALLLARTLGAKGVDAIIMPGESAYVAAAAAGCGRPVLLPDHGGPALDRLHPDLHQFGLDPETLGRALADLILDSLKAVRVVCLAPAARSSMRLVGCLQERLKQRDAHIEIGPEQWYFPSARNLDPQLVNLNQFSESDGGRTVWVVLGGGLPASLQGSILQACPASGYILGDANLMPALADKNLPTLAGRLWVAADWFPAGLDAADITGQSQCGTFQEDVRLRLGKLPGDPELRAFETARLAVLCGEQALDEKRGYRATLESFQPQSQYGGRLQMAGQRASVIRLLRWSGSGFADMGQPRVPVGAP